MSHRLASFSTSLRKRTILYVSKCMEKDEKADSKQNKNSCDKLIVMLHKPMLLFSYVT